MTITIIITRQAANKVKSSVICACTYYPQFPRYDCWNKESDLKIPLLICTSVLVYLLSIILRYTRCVMSMNNLQVPPLFDFCSCVQTAYERLFYVVESLHWNVALECMDPGAHVKDVRIVVEQSSILERRPLSLAHVLVPGTGCFLLDSTAWQFVSLH